MTNLTGGCLCGAVRYECAAEPLFIGNCHCRDCQRSTGSAYVPALAVPARALKITGVTTAAPIVATPLAADFARIAVDDYLVRHPLCRDSCWLPQAVWTIRAASSRAWIFSLPARSPGIT